MATTLRRADTWVITAGAMLFIAVLFTSAYWEPDIRGLHFLQAWMYVAAIALSWRGSRWGYFIGAGAAAFFAFAMFVCQPRYLALFPGLLHPHVRL